MTPVRPSPTSGRGPTAAAAGPMSAPIRTPTPWPRATRPMPSACRRISPTTPARRSAPPAPPPRRTGTAKEGSTLTATPTIGDSDDASATVAYQWQHSSDGTTWSNVAAGGSASTYTLAETDENDFVRVQASFTDDTSQTVSATSTATAAVIDNSSLSVAVTGTAKEGSTLTATPTIGDSDDASATGAYQWQAAGGSGGRDHRGGTQQNS